MAVSRRGDHRASIEADIVALSDRWAQAIVSNDAAQIGRFMSNDWVIVSESGIGTRHDFLALIDSGELTHSAMDRVSEPHIRIAGEVVILTARVTNTAHYGGRTYPADEWTTDVFHNENGHWLCVYTHVTSAAAERDARSGEFD